MGGPTAGDDKSKVSLESGKAMMAKGSHALHSYVASKFEAAIGRALPQMEVRYTNLSITAEVTVTEEVSAQSELPTVYSAIKRSLATFSLSERVEQKQILKNASGVFKPGTITLLLGQPGSGKSSLMRVLSGQFPSNKNVTIEGEILCNGLEQKAIATRLPQFAAYVTQFDKHFPSLTVGETLEFAHEFCGGGLSKHGEKMLTRGTPEENAEALEAAQAYFQHFPELVIEQLGLQNCQDTILGNAMRRGVSGGERKRVTTGVRHEVHDAHGRDQHGAGQRGDLRHHQHAAQYRQEAAQDGGDRFAAAVAGGFRPFDNVVILNQGESMYHGPRDQTVPYFESLGFACPADRDVADYLLDLGTNQQEKYEVDLPAHLTKHPRRASEFAELFRRSRLQIELGQALDAPFHPDLLEDVGEHMEPMPEFRQSFGRTPRR
ncbi:hypothetical protein BBJ28_00002123 [Nothophytophthora sp. Chile5]|nr:hypothetical protein BBJ28_00002123 [Nothophytophthora sp. Chile5]